MSNVIGVVTIDTEPDNVWQDVQSTSMANIKALPRFQQICSEYGVRPTYLVSYSVAADINASKVIESLLSTGGCEIGAHPHFWETPPRLPCDYSVEGLVGSRYSDEILESKFATLDRLLRTRFGPIYSYRSGRWGLDVRQVQLLQRYGYRVETSVTPGIDWSSTGAPDYSDWKSLPYHFQASQASTGLWEIPCTIRPGYFGFLARQRTFYRRALNRVGLGPSWLRGAPGKNSKDAATICAWAYRHCPYIHLMTHSSELSVGTSPYWRSQNDLSEHLAFIEGCFSWWSDHNVAPMTLLEYSEILFQEEGRRAPIPAY